MRAAVIRKSNNKQMPWESTSIIEDFYFVRPGGYQPSLPEVAAPAGKKLDLSRYETEATRLAAVKAQWQQWQSEMNASFQKVQRLDSDANLSANSKARMWQEFMTSYAEDNPHSQTDEDLRTSAMKMKNMWENSAGIDWVFVTGGTFDMGDTFGDGSDDEKPVHSVTVSDFYLSKTEVTQKQWIEIMGSNPSYFKGDNLPVESVS